MSLTRAERRHRRERAVAYAKRKLREWGFSPTRAPYWADNMAKCSCDMCTGHTKPDKTPKINLNEELA